MITLTDIILEIDFKLNLDEVLFMKEDEEDLYLIITENFCAHVNKKDYNIVLEKINKENFLINNSFVIFADKVKEYKIFRDNTELSFYNTTFLAYIDSKYVNEVKTFTTKRKIANF